MANSLVQYMSMDLGLDIEYIRKTISNASNLYTKYKIPKKNNKTRTIYQAKNELKVLQYWIWKRILVLLPVSQNAYAYIKNKNIKDNALVHINAEHIYHTDIKNFFPSIHSKHLCDVLNISKPIIEEKGLWFDDTLEIISNVCFLDDKLCIGTVSSPIISNIVMFTIDEKILNYCKSNNLTYSRYADDIFISSKKYIGKNINDFINEVLQTAGFSINKNKTYFSSKKLGIRVTGVNIINNSFLSIGYKNKKKIKSDLYKYIKYGEGNSNEILGYLSYLKSIEPQTFNSISMKYNKYLKNDVFSFLCEKAKENNRYRTLIDVDIFKTII